jgi:hypothetical protein
MKIVELVNNVKLPISNEEHDLMLLFRNQDTLDRKDLNEREIQIANNLVVKDVLYRKNQDGKITYFKKTN